MYKDPRSRSPISKRCLGTPGAYLPLAFVIIIAVYFLLLGFFPLQEPDEGRYAEIAREMIDRGDFVTPTLDYVKYFEKPPLHYWLTAAGIGLFGRSEFAVRFWPALLSVLTIMGVFVTGRRIYGWRTGAYAALVLAATPIWLIAGRTNTIDPTVSSLIALSLFSFLLFDHATEAGSRRVWLAAFYIFAGLATLAKGLIGLLFPFGIVFAYILLSRRFRLMKELKPWLGIPLYLAVTVPWFVLVSQRNPDFAWFFFIHEHVDRFLSDDHNRTKPFYYFIPILIAALLPLIGYLVPALYHPVKKAWKRCRGRDAGAGFFLVLWFVLIFTFFSLSRSKLGLYILPVFPALALLIGRFLALIERRSIARRTLPAAHRIGMVSCVTLSVAALVASIAARDQIGVPAWPYVTAMLAGGGGILFLAARSGKRSLFIATIRLCSYSVLLTISLFLCAQHVGATLKSARPLTRIIEASAAPGDRIVHLSCYLQNQLFYFDRRPVVAGYLGELDFGISRAANRDEWFWSFERFFEEWRSGRRMWVITKTAKLARIFDDKGNSLVNELGLYHEVEQCGIMTLISNQPLDRDPALTPSSER
ncbi:MAG: glycosyltransferase family 39 protein [Planctomycetota bacterium]